jgi:hypothetical protein
MELLEVEDNGAGISAANYGTLALRHHTVRARWSALSVSHSESSLRFGVVWAPGRRLLSNNGGFRPAQSKLTAFAELEGEERDHGVFSNAVQPPCSLLKTEGVRPARSGDLRLPRGGAVRARRARQPHGRDRARPHRPSAPRLIHFVLLLLLLVLLPLLLQIHEHTRRLCF